MKLQKNPERIPLLTPDEIVQVRQSGKLLGQCFDHIQSMIHDGLPLAELNDAIHTFITERGAVPAFLNYSGFPASACLSVNEVIIHGIPDGRVLKEGDIIGIDIGVKRNGWVSDRTMTYAVGKIDPLTHKLIKVTREALRRGIEQAKVGNHVGDISHHIQSYVESEGFSIVRDFVGHGVGRKLHEEPSVPNYGERRRGPVLQKGMVIAIEPMVNVGTYRTKTLKDGWTVITKDRKRSAHFEHTVAIGDGGGVILTNSE